jgi:hypothetical protein
MRRLLIAALIVGILALVYFKPWLRSPAPAPSPSPAPALRTFEVPSWGNDAPALLLYLPAEARMEHRRGPDFDVTYFTLPSGGRLGIYAGHHPNATHPANAQSLKGIIGGVPVTWFCWQATANEAGKYTCETVVEGLFRSPASAPPAQDIPLPPGKPPAPKTPPPPSSSGVESLTLHVWAAGSGKDVEQLCGYAAKLRLKPPAGSP